MSADGPVSIGIVGAGGIARFHARGIADAGPSLQLRAVCDTSQEALDRFCERRAPTWTRIWTSRSASGRGKHCSPMEPRPGRRWSWCRQFSDPWIRGSP